MSLKCLKSFYKVLPLFVFTLNPSPLFIVALITTPSRTSIKFDSPFIPLSIFVEFNNPPSPSMDVLYQSFIKIMLFIPIRYIITGVELGETKIIISSVTESGIRISSLPVNVQVFPPLALQPRNITMYVGTSVQITSKGGPYPDVNIAYSIQSGDIACK